MNEREALKLALEALEYEPIGKTSGEKDLKDQAITAIKEALAQQCVCGEPNTAGTHRTDGPCLAPQPEQEPVAWVHNFIEGGISIGKRPIDLDRHPDRWTALYKYPEPCPTCEALARTVMLDQTSHDTTPPQRTWVGLTDEDCFEALKAVDPEAKRLPLGFSMYAANIQAKLKEKNT